LATLVTLVSPASAQMFRGGSHVWTSFSSSSWARGEDGHMHENVEKSRSETINNEDGAKVFEKKVHCANGLCEESSTKITKPGSVEGGGNMGLAGRPPMLSREMMPTSLTSLLNHLMPARSPMIEIEAVPMPRVEVHEVHCENGHCEETKTSERNTAHPTPIAMPFELPMRMQSIFDSLNTFMPMLRSSSLVDFDDEGGVGTPKVEVMQPASPLEVFFGTQPQMEIQQPVEVQIIPLKSWEPAPFNLRGSDLPQLQEPKAALKGPQVPSQKPKLLSGVKINAMDDIAIAMTAAVLSAFTVLLAFIIIAYRHFLGKKLCAREPTLREALGEPLAPEGADSSATAPPPALAAAPIAAVAGRVVAPAKDDASWAELEKEKARTVADMYLQELYSKTLKKISVPQPRPLVL